MTVDIQRVQEIALDFASKTGYVYWTNEIKSINLDKNAVWQVTIENFKDDKKQIIEIKISDTNGRIIGYWKRG